MGRGRGPGAGRRLRCATARRFHVSEVEERIYLESQSEVTSVLTPSLRPPAPGPRPLLGETVRQAGMLFTAQSGALAAGLLISLIQARWMEPAEMGRFAFRL